MRLERIIVSLTTYSKRIGNIPAVLDSVFSQNVRPDLVVLNLAYDEAIPLEVQMYIQKHEVEVNRVPDTKVYKKLIPTLHKYPNDCIITIDDDFIYPKGMIEDFMNIHEKYPHNPISGNRIVFFGRQCHCGCASLVKREFFGDYLDSIDNEVIKNCPSDDIVYTYFINKAGLSYIRSEAEYFINMESYNEGKGYTESEDGFEGVAKSFRYLTERFGNVEAPLLTYSPDPYLADILHDIHQKDIVRQREEAKQEVYSSITFRIGHALMKPFSFLKK
jgi:hypothetical protein